MFGWVLTFFVLAVLAAILGFNIVAGLSALIARILFLVLLAGIVIAGAMRALSGRTP